MPLFAGIAQWAGHSPPFAPSRGWRVHHSPFSCKNRYLMFALWKKTAAQAIVGSIDWAFRWLEKPRNRDISARSYALRSVYIQLPFFFFILRMLSIYNAWESKCSKIFPYYTVIPPHNESKCTKKSIRYVRNSLRGGFLLYYGVALLSRDMKFDLVYRGFVM